MEAEPDFETKKAISNVKSLGTAQYLFGAIGLATPLIAMSRRTGHMGGVMKELDDLLYTGDVGFYTWSAMATTVVAALFLIGCGAATSKLKPVARTLTLVHVALGFANGLFNVVVAFGIMVPALLQFADRAGPAGLGGAIGGIIGGFIGGIFGFLFPGLELWMITRPKVKDILTG